MTDFFDKSTTGSAPGEPTSTQPAGAADPETAAVPVPTQPIAAPEASTPVARPNRARSFAAIGLIALVVGATTLITLSLTAGAPSSTVLGYVPGDSTVYGELRLDLPGDQRQKVGQFLSKFPGFADQASLETKLDETLDRLVADASGGKQDYTSDIKPWFDGQIGFSVGPIPEVSSADPSARAKDVRALLLVSIKDAALARTWFSKLFSDAGVASTSETYGGTELTLFTDPNMPDVKAGFATVAGKVAIVGDATSVKAAVDTKGASALAKQTGLGDAQAALKGDDVGFVYVDMQALLDASMRMSTTFSSAPPMSDALRGIVPDWVATRVRVEGDALMLDTAMRHVDAAPGPKQNRTNGVAAFAPSSTIAMFTGNDAGASLKQTIALYRNEPQFADAFKQIDQAAGLVGGLDAAVGWMGDSGVVIAKSGDTVEGGVVSIPADAAAGKQLLTQIRSFIALGGAQSGISARDETYNGQTITIVDLGSIQGLAGMAGMLGGLPTAPGNLPDGRAEVAYVATDQVVVIGSSADFVKHVLDAGSGPSLADDARFQALVGRVASQHTGLNFLDIAAIRGMVEGAMSSASAQERAEYEESIKPFLVPFDAYIASGVVGGSVDQGRAVITVK
jgi:hypothetical protein